MPGEQAFVSCGTSTGPVVMRLHRDWSPRGYDRAVELFEQGFFDHSHFFRPVPNFLVQFGITYSQDDKLRSFMRQPILDDPQLDPRIPFEQGTMAFAGSGENSRTTQMFISYGAIAQLGTNPWETPFGVVEDGMDNVINFYSYGDMPPWGNGPHPHRIENEGVSYIEKDFPLLAKFETCKVERIPGSDGEVEL